MDSHHWQSQNPLNTKTSDTCTLSCIVRVNAMETQNPVNLSTTEPNLPAPPSAKALLCPANLSTMVLPHLAHPNAMVQPNLVGIPSNLLAHLGPMSITGLNETLSDTTHTNVTVSNDLPEAPHMSLTITTTFWPPAPGDLIQAVTQALAWTPADRTPPIFDFQMSPDATQHNLQILQENNWDLQHILLCDHHSPLHPGSEF